MKFAGTNIILCDHKLHKHKIF